MTSVIHFWLLMEQAYDKDDIIALRDFSETIPAYFPTLATKDNVQSICSKTQKEVWICNCGYKNVATRAYCEKCWNDQFGFEEDESNPVRIVAIIRTRLKVIERLNEMTS